MRILKNTSAALAFCAAALAPLAGCGPFWVDPYIAVKQSELNWLEVHLYRMDRDPVKRTSLYLNGGGHVEIKKGTSRLIGDDFAKRADDPSWDDVRTRRLMTDPKHAQDIFQNLVNHGLLDREKFFKGANKPKDGGKKDDAPPSRFMAVKANVSNQAYSELVNLFEADPDLAEQLCDLIREFDDPTFRRGGRRR